MSAAHPSAAAPSGRRHSEDTCRLIRSCDATGDSIGTARERAPRPRVVAKIRPAARVLYRPRAARPHDSAAAQDCAAGRRQSTRAGVVHRPRRNAGRGPHTPTGPSCRVCPRDVCRGVPSRPAERTYGAQTSCPPLVEPVRRRRPRNLCARPEPRARPLDRSNISHKCRPWASTFWVVAYDRCSSVTEIRFLDSRRSPGDAPRSGQEARQRRPSCTERRVSSSLGHCKQMHAPDERRPHVVGNFRDRKS
jgi:hypothetical protein